jgi:hypothetical protein
VLVWLFFPAADIVSPDWDLLVTDTEGHSIGGASVTVFSQQYSIERDGHEETKITSADGRVHFDERRIRAVNLVRLVGTLRNLNQGAHPVLVCTRTCMHPQKATAIQVHSISLGRMSARAALRAKRDNHRPLP